MVEFIESFPLEDRVGFITVLCSAVMAWFVVEMWCLAERDRKNRKRRIREQMNRIPPPRK